jgi:hypothetical protein
MDLPFFHRNANWHEFRRIEQPVLKYSIFTQILPLDLQLRTAGESKMKTQFIIRRFAQRKKTVNETNETEEGIVSETVSEVFGLSRAISQDCARFETCEFASWENPNGCPREIQTWV